jgi:hypothetical protein
MRGQTIQFNGEREASAILATLDDDVSIDALTWGGRTTPISLATDHAEQRHLLGDDIVRVVIGADPYDVEAHTLTLRFPNAEEAARFRTKVLAGTLLVGAIAAPAALAVSQVTASPERVVTGPMAVPQGAPVTDQGLPLVIRAAPVVDEPEEPGFTLQSKGTTEATGEDNSSGSSVMWIHGTNTEIK